MIYVALTNQKLHRRGAQILTEAAGVSASKAKHALRQTGHDLPTALVTLKTGANIVAARRSLRRFGGNVRMALGLNPKRRVIAKGQGK
jgi:N-acetylmuramic acid 6-phosphate (MurNAc-6-P) etherase